MTRWNVSLLDWFTGMPPHAGGIAVNDQRSLGRCNGRKPAGFQMSKVVWRYSVTCGLRGCYMPNSNFGPYEGTTRRELIDTARECLRMVDASEHRLSQVEWRDRVWPFIKRHGSSTAHFSIDIGNGEELAFHGLTEDEYTAASVD